MFRNKCLTFIWVLLVLLASCSPSAQNVQGEYWVVFSAKQAEKLRIGSWFVAGDQTLTYWSPTEENVLAVEDGLSAFLQDHADQFHQPDIPVWDWLEKYNRQYIGIVLDDRQIIYANFFCDSVTDWRTDFVIVADGGDCFFQFKYDVDAAEFFDLQVNGSA